MSCGVAKKRRKGQRCAPAAAKEVAYCSLSFIILTYFVGVHVVLCLYFHNFIGILISEVCILQLAWQFLGTPRGSPHMWQLLPSSAQQKK